MLIPVQGVAGLKPCRVIGLVEQPVAAKLRLLARIEGLSVPGIMARCVMSYIAEREAALAERGITLE